MGFWPIRVHVCPIYIESPIYIIINHNEAINQSFLFNSYKNINSPKGCMTLVPSIRWNIQRVQHQEPIINMWHLIQIIQYVNILLHN